MTSVFCVSVVCREGQAVASLAFGVGQKSDVSCAFDGGGELTLMISAGTGDTTGKDLRAVRSELPETGGVLVIDLFDFVDAERANLAASTAAVSIVCHDGVYLLVKMLSLEGEFVIHFDG